MKTIERRWASGEYEGGATKRIKKSKMGKRVVREDRKMGSERRI